MKESSLHRDLAKTNINITPLRGLTTAYLEDIQTDISTGIHVGMEDLGQESYLRGREGEVNRNVNLDLEDPAMVGTVSRSHDGSGELVQSVLIQ